VNKPNYGLDAPPVIRNLVVAGGCCLFVGLTGWVLLAGVQRGAAYAVLFVMLFSAACFLITAGAMIWSSKRGKLIAREKLINSLSLRGHETVLDVGCGRGLLLTCAAKKLTSGKAIGLDLWQTEDQSGNDPLVTRANARLEGVADKVDVRSGDMREMPIPDTSVDAVVSNIAIHNITEKAGREKAIREIDRVLRPSGKIALSDFRHVDEYGETLRSLGWRDLRLSRPLFLIFPPVRILTGEKPGATKQ